MQTAPHTDLRPHFLTIDDIVQEHNGVLDWPAFWGNDNPVEVDIGCGRGMFIVNASQANSDVNYLGIEIDYREGRHGAKRLKRREITNARVLGGDVFIALTKMIRPHTVDAIHVYFPDPWWKKKHRRRRVFTDRFVGLCAQALKPGSLLHSWTDVEEYFEVISALMDNHELFDTLPPPEERTAEHDLDYQTSFERKKRQAGETIYRGLWRRRPLSEGGATSE